MVRIIWKIIGLVIALAVLCFVLNSVLGLHVTPAGIFSHIVEAAKSIFGFVVGGVIH